MPTPHEVVRTALRRTDQPGPGVHWDRLVAAVREVSRPQAATDGKESLSAESEEVLRALLDFDGTIQLTADSTLPHAMPPEEMLRAHALQVLARSDLEKHRAVIQRIADRSGSSDRLAALARTALQNR